MSIAAALFDNRVYNFAQAFGVEDTTTNAMRGAINDWFNLYYQSVPVEGEDPCQRLPVTIVSKLAKTMFSEYETDASDEFAVTLLSALNRERKQAVQKAMVGGECFIKPI